MAPNSGSETVATATAEPEVTLDELLRRALANNPTLTVSREEQEAAAQRAQAARSRLSPALQVVPRIIGPANAASEEIILSQPVDFFGQRRARSAVALAELRRAEAASTLAVRTLTIQVRGAATDLFAAQEAEALGEVQVEVATQFRDAAARRAQLGDVPPVQAQRAALELLRAQNELTGVRAERRARRTVLNQLTGSPPEAPLRVALPLDPTATALLRSLPASPRFPIGGASNAAGGQAGAVGGEAGAGGGQGAVPSISGGSASGGAGVGTTGASGGIPSVTLPPSGAAGAPSTSGVTSGNTGQAPLILGASSQIGSDLVAARSNLAAGLGSRPDIVGAQATLEARQAQVQVLRANRRPQVEFQVRRNAVFANSRAAAEAVGPIGTALRAVVTIPLGSGASRGEQRALEAEVRAQQAQIAVLRSQAGAQLEGALIRLQQQRETVERYRTPVTGILPQTIDLLRKTQIGFAAGASTYLEVLEAQRTTRQVQTEYLQALVGAQTQQIALESAIGANPSGSISGTLVNPGGAATPPDVAAPGTVQPGTIPPVENPPLNPPGLNLPGTLPPTETPGGATP